MTYAGIGAILFRFAGLLMIGSMLLAMLPALLAGVPIMGQILALVGITSIPAIILIVASKPLGRLLAAGLE